MPEPVGGREFTFADQLCPNEIALLYVSQINGVKELLPLMEK
jgi:hypothetical protein